MKCLHVPGWLVWAETPQYVALFIGKFVEAIQRVGNVGWQHSAIDLISKVYLVCVCINAPSRVAVENQTQFNGLFGYLWFLVWHTWGK